MGLTEQGRGVMMTVGKRGIYEHMNIDRSPPEHRLFTKLVV
jgi:hypothetical protein